MWRAECLADTALLLRTVVATIEKDEAALFSCVRLVCSSRLKRGKTAPFDAIAISEKIAAGDFKRHFSVL